MQPATTFTQPEIKTLEHASVAEITEAFNAAFADYKIKLQLTAEDMRTKIKAEGIQLQYSAGAYHDGKLVSFILHGVDTIEGEQRVYNAGTGTLPAYRGRRIAQQLYGFIIAQLYQKGIQQHQLEVFDDNEKAIKVYVANGFKHTRTLNCYKGKVQEAPVPESVVVEEVPLDSALFQKFWDYTPSWQNDFPSIGRNLEAHKVIGVKHDTRLVGYAIYVAATGRLRQFAVDARYRRRGVGTALFRYISNKCSGNELLVTNVEDDAATNQFFEHLGFNRFLVLYEMHLDLGALEDAPF